MSPAAVIFDVDGPLLELTSDEEDLYFAPLEKYYGLKSLSRDWSSYPIRNDIEIYQNILEHHLGTPLPGDTLDIVIADYLTALRSGHAAGTLKTIAIPGARTILERLSKIEDLALGVATANLVTAAQLRLEQTGMWRYVEKFPGGAEAGGTKSNILRTVLSRLDLPKDRIVFLGDNLNDLQAGRDNGVHFIGFHTDRMRQQRLREAGATTVCGDHETTWHLIRQILELP